MPANLIGPFQFIELGQPPDLFEDQIAVHHRAGTDGALLAKLGTWCEPFEVDSLAGTQTFAQACQLMVAYKSLPGASAVQVTWSNFGLVSARHLYKVLNVRTLAIQRLILGTGPDGDYFAEIKARWRLIAVRF